MEIYCQRCGEPWRLKTLYELGSYGMDFLAGKGCPACAMGEKAPTERPQRAEMMQVLMEELHGDLDVIAIELEDMNKMGLLNDGRD
jgi:hypothetical protein